MCPLVSVCVGKRSEKREKREGNKGKHKHRINVLLLGSREVGRVGEQGPEGSDDGSRAGIVCGGCECRAERLDCLPHRETERVLVGVAVDAAHRLCDRGKVLGDVCDGVCVRVNAQRKGYAKERVEPNLKRRVGKR